MEHQGGVLMDVRLVEWPRSAIALAALAALRCTNDCRYDRLRDKVRDSDPEKVVERVTASGHTSVLEHATYTFAIDGISRVTSHQLVRHRLASYSQQSQRYTGISADIVYPPTVLEAGEGSHALLDALTTMELAWRNAADLMVKAGVPAEDIRYFYPQGTETALIVTMNLRELSHFCGLRMCNRAQWEIRELAVKMAEAVIRQDPRLGIEKFLVPQCDRLGYCPESRGCGMKPTLVKLTETAERGRTKKRILDYARGIADDIGEGEE